MSYHRVAADRSEAAVKALTAGLDLELPALDCFGAPLKTAIGEGKVAMSVVDTAVRRVLTAKMRLGLFESPYVDASRVKAGFRRPGQRPSRQACCHPRHCPPGQRRCAAIGRARLQIGRHRPRG